MYWNKSIARFSVNSLHYAQNLNMYCTFCAGYSIIVITNEKI